MAMVEDIGSGALLGRGAAIGRYLVLSLIGKGGMGEVYAAYDPELDRKVAIKVLRTSSSAGADPAEGRARILREAQALAQLSDPNVVAVYDVGTFGERVFLAMEFVDGSTLSFWQQSQVRSWREVVELYSAAGRGLAAAHKRGLVHRDFKPENAMVGRDGQVLVMDFGLARSDAPPAVGEAVAEAKRISSGIGRTPAQMAALVSSPVLGRTPGAALAGKQDDQPAGDAVPAAPASSASERGPLLVTVSRRVNPDTGATREPSRATPLPPSGLVTRPDAPSWDSQTRDLAVPAALEPTPGRSPNGLASPLTQSGAMMGTPAYMAPEQFAGKVADAKSDQFSFCVALYEALYGDRPFIGKNLPDLTRQVMAGKVREAPAGSHVPGWLRKVLLRGLRVERDDRHASMEALLDALSRDPNRRRRRYAAGASVAALIVALTGGLVEMSQKQKTKCRGADARLAGVWELPGLAGAPLSPRKAAIRGAFMKTGKRYASEAFTLVQNTLDRYVGAWNDMHRDACEATHVRGEQSAEVLDLRMICLQDRFNEIRALTGVFSDANGDVVSKAAEAVQSLRPVQQCGDIATLKAVVRPPDDPAVRRAVADVRVALAEVKALGQSGKAKQAAARIAAIVGAARKTQYEPLMAEALLESGEIAILSGDYAGSESKYEDALWLAESSRHDEVAVQASAQLVYSVGYALGRFKDGERWARYASAVLRRLGPGHDLMVGWLANNRAVLYEKQGRYQDALEAGREAVTAKARVLGDAHFDVAISSSNVASALMRLGRIDEAIEMDQRAIEILTATLGSQHPTMAAALDVLAESMYARKDFDKAAQLSEKVIGIWEREWGTDHLALAYPLTTLGEALVGLEQAKKAISPLERALKIREMADPEPQLLAETRFALARALALSGSSQPKARRLADQALKELRGDSSIRARTEAAEIERWLSSPFASSNSLSMR